MQNVRIVPEGDSSLLIQFEQVISPEVNQKIAAAAKLIKAQQISGIIDMIPTYCSLLINYNPLVISYADLYKRVESIVRMESRSEAGRKKVWEIPVLYGGEYGPDIATIADHAGITEEEVIRIHTSRDYLIYMLGFLPGFTYLGGLDERIHTPRLSTPRVRIPAGSVGIGGSQTGIYPMDSPGGWQLMGMTPVKTYDPERETPILVEAGDYIRFVPVTEEEYREIKAMVDDGTYKVKVHEGDD
ncbi:5-oxoprolinase subunit PxpB [Oribacterium sp. WCC10]|uniref:5-oxoprolinase subunit PxpB n=1 Tax=Oribacterium sp. WCC10 TaxID=1855343 RepID=UPI0008E47B29|nr:5-oxoprolinase subunit PxpB [Oribacterium sp. WCC10]SFG15223.1 sensor histidine kinase inhibitor, KipI family [Oribacterium sp. WCC10]